MTINQIKAIRAMATSRLCKSDAIEAGIDACRSDTYKKALAAFHVERNACLDYYKRKEMRPPRAEPVKGAEQLREWLSHEYDRIMLLRETRAQMRIKPVSQTLRQRCLAKISQAVQKAYRTCGYRKSESGWAGGQHFVEIQAGAVIPSAHGFTERVWSTNGKWSGTNSTHKVNVLSSWYNRVHSRGIGQVDGLLTLDATVCQSESLKGGEEALDATWVVQGRGVSLHTEEGILYRRYGGAWIHGTSVKHARSLNNKRLAALAEERLARMARKARFQEEILQLAGILVTREDCTAVGLCDPGQRDWLAKRGLDTDTQAVPANKLLEMAILANDRVDCVRRAIRFAASKTTQQAA